MSSIEQRSYAPALALAVALFAAGCQRDADTQREAAPSAGAPAASRITAAAETAAQVIDGDKLRGVIAELASDAYGGRLPGTDGDLRARAYLAGFQHAGGLRAALLMGLRTLVFLAFYQHPQVLASLGVDWAGRADELTRRRAILLHEHPA